jgi:hypothetical protein
MEKAKVADALAGGSNAPGFADSIMSGIASW